jgi:hypothetical protein
MLTAKIAWSAKGRGDANWNVSLIKDGIKHMVNRL